MSILAGFFSAADSSCVPLRSTSSLRRGEGGVGGRASRPGWATDWVMADGGIESGGLWMVCDGVPM